VAEAARRLGCSTAVLYHWIHTQQLTARRGQGNRFCIPRPLSSQSAVAPVTG
jgi:excisionase family DNA binding protein